MTPERRDIIRLQARPSDATAILLRDLEVAERALEDIAEGMDGNGMHSDECEAHSVFPDDARFDERCDCGITLARETLEKTRS